MLTRFVLTGFLAMVLAVSSFPAQTNFKGYSFEANVLAEDWGGFSEIRKNGRPWLQVRPGSEYSIVIYNPLPVRVAVAVTIDGLNTVDGKRTTPDRAQKWMIDANSSITLRGWQTDRGSLRRFVFTDENGSYAEWKGKRDRKNYTRNLGVIGIAYFWNSEELRAALRPPEPFYGHGWSYDKRSESAAPAAADEAETRPQQAPAAKSRAGTGMGDREYNNVYEVEFRYDTGMYRSRDALTIYYEFARNDPRPLPFIDDERDRQFAPEMP
jgi:hypothetical protein